MPAVATDDLRKTYGRIEALRGVSIAVEPGQIFGLLGQNGAGKSTLIKILLGIVKLTEGEAELLGRPAGNTEVRRRVGYLPEDHQFPQYHTANSAARHLRPDVRPEPAGPPQAGRRGTGVRRPEEAGGLQDSHLLEGHETTPGHRLGVLPRPGGDLPGRADGRRGPGRPQGDSGLAVAAQGGGADHLRQLAPAGRGGADFRPGGHPAQGRAEAHRHGGRTDPPGGAVRGRPGRRRGVPNGRRGPARLPLRGRPAGGPRSWSATGRTPSTAC